MQQVIDTHIHIWDLEKTSYYWLQGDTSLLNRNYKINELEQGRVQAGVTDGVLVQATNNYVDTDMMLEVAAEHKWIKGVVGWLPLLQPQQVDIELTAKYLKNPYYKGVRHQIHDEPNDKWLLQPAVLDSLNLLDTYKLPYDLVGIKTEHIKAALDVAHKLPGLKMVFDHLNQPPMQSGERYGIWGTLIKEAAKHHNFYAKISGLGTTSGCVWNEEKIKPYVDYVIHTFGVDRCFLGGDWPVSLLAGSYTRTWEIYRNVILDLVGAQDADKIFYTNAQQFYNL